VLALLVRHRPNQLLLDEPTNHLDLEMRHALTRALAGYEGSLVLVSHDRALLRTICDRFLLVADGRVLDFDGDLDDYVAWLSDLRSRQAAATTGPDVGGKAARVAAREAAAANRQALLARRRPLLKESRQLDDELARLRTERDDVTGQLADPTLYAGNPDKVRIADLTRREAELAARLVAAEERWLEVHLELEQIGES
jgi:ATP-binding cassette subfamily F protein 3